MCFRFGFHSCRLIVFNACAVIILFNAVEESIERVPAATFLLVVEFRFVFGVGSCI